MSDLLQSPVRSREPRRLRWFARLSLLAVCAPAWANCSIDSRTVRTRGDERAGGSGGNGQSLGGSAGSGPPATGGAGSTGEGGSAGMIQDAADAAPECRIDADCPGATACLERSCELGKCVDKPVPPGAECFDDGGIRCDGKGVCGRCRFDGSKNDNETAPDCGGTDCPPCEHLLGCRINSDCKSGVCTQDVCQVPTCSDGVKNGEEGGIDCGEKCTRRCRQGESCGKDPDCSTEHCSRGVCCGVACNGPCLECAAGTGACTFVTLGGNPSGTCACDGKGKCQSCNDLTKNGDETEVDCGGAHCAPCAEGQRCALERDCASCLCFGSVCQRPNCSNRVLDACESDVDCGGPCGDICASGQVCKAKSDCASHECANGRCVGP